MRKGKLLARGRTADVFEWGKQSVLKLFLKDEGVTREIENTRLIIKIGIRIPQVLDCVEIEGRKGIIYERINGTTLMRSIEPTEASLTACAKLMAAAQAEIHNVIHEYPENLTKEFIAKIQKLSSISAENRSEITGLLEKLPKGKSVCHYDFHPDNIILSPAGPVVIDWQNALVGNPNADVMRTSFILKSQELPADPPDWLLNRSCRLYFHDVYLAEYLKLQQVDEADIRLWLPPTAAIRKGEGVL